MKKNSNIHVQNMVASADTKKILSLEKLLHILPDGEYEPEQFPGLVFRMTEPKVATLIFRSGKIICVGAHTKSDIKKAIENVVKYIRETGVNVSSKDIKIKVENIVISANLGMELPLDVLAFQLESSEYEPEQFPGLVYRIYDPKVAFLLFSSGRIVCAGAKSMKAVNKALTFLKDKLKSIKM